MAAIALSKVRSEILALEKRDRFADANQITRDTEAVQYEPEKIVSCSFVMAAMLRGFGRR